MHLFFYSSHTILEHTKLIPNRCYAQIEKKKNLSERQGQQKEKRCLLDVVFIQLTVHSTDAHVLHHLNTTESCNTSS